MQRRLNRNLLIGTVALAAAAFGGGAYAATQTSSPNPREAFLQDVAHRLNVTPAQLRVAFHQAFLDELNQAVTSGRLTRAEANAIRSRIVQTGSIALGALMAPAGFLPGARPFPPGARRLLPGPPGRLLPAFAGPRGFLAHLRFFRRAVFGGLASAARYLGETPAKVMSQLRTGKSLAQIASSRGKSVTALRNAIVAHERRLLSRLVQAKVMTRAREHRLLSRLSRRIQKLMNRKDLGLAALVFVRRARWHAPPWIPGNTPPPPLPAHP